jgi:indolepyruvate ferredoxin oxidoreductase
MGTAFDVFGHTEERRTERALIEEYRQSVEELIAGLTEDKLLHALGVARIPEQIKGYGHVKERSLAAARLQRQAALQAFRGSTQVQVQAA